MAQKPIKLKKRKIKSVSDWVQETYYVRKKNDTIKEGEYRMNVKEKLVCNGFFQNNKRTGIWKFYGYEGRLVYEGEYSQGHRVGKWTYTLDGSKSGEIFYGNGLVDSAFGFAETGAKIYNYVAQDGSGGKAVRSYTNGQKKEIFSVNRFQINGSYESFFENGELHKKAEYKNGTISTIHLIKNENGDTLEAGTLKNGNGTLVNYSFDSSNRLYKSGFYHYENGERHGQAKTFDSEGNIISEGRYSKGYKVGKWRFTRNGRSTQVFYSKVKEMVHLKNKNIPCVFSGDMPSNRKQPAIFYNKTNGYANYLQDVFVYPSQAAAEGIGAELRIQFGIDLDGNLISYQVLKGGFKPIEDEAVRVVAMMPWWTPKIVDGLPASQYNIIPISLGISE